LNKDTRLSRILHVLIHMNHHDVPLTSEKIAIMLNTNPTVVRRILASLREHGYVHSEKGHNGGWTLAKPISEITLLNVYESLGKPDIFSLGFSNNDSKCLIELSVNDSLKKSMEEANNVILKRFGEVTLDLIAKNFGNCN
jgi:Rrf2 family protein